jgi:hypothetical protein
MPLSGGADVAADVAAACTSPPSACKRCFAGAGERVACKPPQPPPLLLVRNAGRQAGRRVGRQAGRQAAHLSSRGALRAAAAASSSSRSAALV